MTSFPTLVTEHLDPSIAEQIGEPGRPAKFLVLYGSVRERSFS
jgi:hypothetical protein